MIIDGRGRAGTIYKIIKVSAAKTGKNVVLLKYQTATDMPSYPLKSDNFKTFGWKDL